MKVISNKNGDLSSQFDDVNENDIPILEQIANLPPQFTDTPHQTILINSHTDANKGRVKGYLFLEDIFVFSKGFKKVTKNLGFIIMFKTADLQDIICTSMADDINVTINNLYLFIPNLIPSVETQLLFNEATQNNYKISYDDWYTERQIRSDLLVQHDIGSAQQLNSPPKYIISAHQTKDRILTSNKNNNIAIFDNLDLRKYYVEIDTQRYPRDSILNNYTEKDYLDQYRDLKLFFKKYIGEPILYPLMSYPDMKTKYPIKIIDLRHQTDHITPKKIQLLQEHGNDSDTARFCIIIFRRREIELTSDGNKLIEVKTV